MVEAETTASGGMPSNLVYGPRGCWLQAARAMIVAPSTATFNADICTITINRPRTFIV